MTGRCETLLGRKNGILWNSLSYHKYVLTLEGPFQLCLWSFWAGPFLVGYFYVFSALHLVLKRYWKSWLSSTLQHLGEFFPWGFLNLGKVRKSFCHWHSRDNKCRLGNSGRVRESCWAPWKSILFLVAVFVSEPCASQPSTSGHIFVTHPCDKDWSWGRSNK
jgi:hypothetical protein